MELKACLVLVCIPLVFGIPAITERRVSRDLSKLDGLRARLLRLQNQIDELTSAEQNAQRAEDSSTKASDVKSDNAGDARMLKGVEEGQMMSKRQQQVQELARSLGDDASSDLHALADTLNKLLRKKPKDFVEEPHRYNSAGEYLGNEYNTYGKDEIYGKGTDSGEDSDEEDETRQLQNIYNMLQKMHHRQRGGRVDLNARTSQNRLGSDRGTSDPLRSSRYETEEGTFGDFLENSEGSRPVVPSYAPQARRPGLRGAVLSAVERKLLAIIQDARDAGFSVEDIIRDLQNKVDSAKRERLREIENQLNDLSRSRA